MRSGRAAVYMDMTDLTPACARMIDLLANITDEQLSLPALCAA